MAGQPEPEEQHAAPGTPGRRIGLKAAPLIPLTLAITAWRWMELRGRLIGLMVFSWPLGELAGDLKIIPDTPWATNGLSVAIILGCSAWLIWMPLHGQKRWRASRGRSGARIASATWQQYAEAHEKVSQEGLARVAANSAEICAIQEQAEEQERDIEALKRHVIALSRALAAAYAAAGQGVPADIGSASHLRLAVDNTRRGSQSAS